MDKIKRFAVKNRFTRTLIYICYILYSKIMGLGYLLLHIKPMQCNKVVFSSAKGKRYGDNPMYISDELLKRRADLDIVWLLDSSVDETIREGIRVVPYSAWNVMRELSDAKVWVDSNMKYAGFRKRKGQYYMQTWHGSYGLKKIGVDLGDKLPVFDRYSNAYNARNIDAMLTNSAQTTEIYRRAFEYSGEVLEYGSPRNDMFFGETESCLEKVYRHFGLKDQHIALYAPTFRNDYRTDDLKLDNERLRRALSQRFGGEWVVLIRLHPNNLSDAADFIDYNDHILNASPYSIMQELLAASDVLITDYSSCMFDFVTTGKKCFIYASDLEKYNHERGNYFAMDELPFPLAQNNDVLERNILSFEDAAYQKDLKALFERVGLCETGHASEKAADHILQWISEDK